MRRLLRDFAERGGTVLLSSHLLHEVERIADELVLIGHGRVVARGTKDQLLRSGGTLEDIFLQLTADTQREGVPS